jgi:hypothetical protein
MCYNFGVWFLKSRALHMNDEAPPDPSTAALMIDDDRDFSTSDTAKLLPFVCELMPHDPNVEELPRRYLVIGPEPTAEVDDASMAPRD